MFTCANLFQSAQIKMNGVTVSRINEYLPQIDALDKRLNNSKSWIDSALGDTNFSDPDFKARRSQVTSDGTLFVKKVNASIQDLAYTRVQMGFDAAGAGANSWTYDAAASTLTYAQGVDGAGLDAAGASAAFPVGSYFAFTSFFAVVADDPRLNKLVKVLENDGAGVLIVESGKIPANVGAEGRNEFSRVAIGDDGDVSEARNVQEFELLWQPPLSLFKVDHAIPTSDINLEFTPQTASNIQTACIESLLGDGNKTPNLATIGAPTAGSSFRFSVEDAYLYNCMVVGPRVDNKIYYLDLDQIRGQAINIQTPDQQQRPFDISPNTYGVSVLYQDNRCLTDSQASASKFKAYNAALTAPTDLQLERLYINYAGQNIPESMTDMKFTAGVDLTTQRYLDTQLYSGAFSDSGGPETLREWQERGPFYHYRTPKDSRDVSTKLTVHQKFVTGTDVANTRLMIFDHTRAFARVTIRDGRVKEVYVSE